MDNSNVEKDMTNTDIEVTEDVVTSLNETKFYKKQN